jgi:hypothetical protein
MTGPILDGFTLFRSPVNKGTPVKMLPNGEPAFGPTERIPLPEALAPQLAEDLRSYFTQRRTARGARTHVYYLSGRITGTCNGRSVGRRVSQTQTHMYFCHEHASNGGSTGKGCRYYEAELLENYVWRGVVGVLGNRNLLERAADDWIGTLPVNSGDYVSRIADLDKKLTENERMRTTELIKYAKAGIDPIVVKAAQDQFETEAKELASQRAVAQSLLSELETALERKEQIMRLADLSAERLLNLAPERRLQVIEMLDLQVQITEDTKNVKLAHPCKIEAYFKENEKLVPDTLTDEQWDQLVAKVPALSPRNRKISLRAVMEAGLYKVRHDVRWTQLPPGFPPQVSARAIWLQWVKDGTLAAVVASLGDDYAGTAVGDRDIPKMRVTGVLENTVASLLPQGVNNVLRSIDTVSSGAIEILRSTSSTAPRPGFTLDLGQSAA